MKISVKVVPGASSDQIGWLGNDLKVRLQAPPQDGKANKRLCAFLEQKLGLTKGAVEIVSGHASHHKILEISGIDPETLQTKIPGP